MKKHQEIQKVRKADRLRFETWLEFTIGLKESKIKAISKKVEKRVDFWIEEGNKIGRREMFWDLVPVSKSAKKNKITATREGK
jgi:hypothetical protein